MTTTRQMAARKWPLRISLIAQNGENKAKKPAINPSGKKSQIFEEMLAFLSCFCLFSSSVSGLISASEAIAGRPQDAHVSV